MHYHWDTIIEELGPPLFRYFRADRGSREEASDCVQETFARLVNQVNEKVYLIEQGSIRQYAFGIARLIRLEQSRSGKKLSLVEDVSTLDQHIEQPAIKEAPHDLDRLRSSIGALGEPLTEIFLLLIDHEHDLQTISELMKLPLGTVKSHIHRGKTKLKEMLYG